MHKGVSEYSLISEIEEVPLNPHEWVSKYFNDLFAHALYKTGEQELAEDLVQDTFLAGLTGLHTYKTLSSEKTWLFSILKNKITDYYRKASTRYEFTYKQLSIKESSFLDSYFNKDVCEVVNSKSNNWGWDNSLPLEKKEFKQILDHALNKLPRNWHEVINQKLIEGKETKDICNDMNISPTNYWVIMHRARLRLRGCLQKTN